MLTYDLTSKSGPLYECLYNFIKEDIKSGKIKFNDKMPSKRTFARNLGVSSITVANAYEQLISEGYLYTLPKKGYYVSDISGMINDRSASFTDRMNKKIHIPHDDAEIWYDFSSNNTETGSFPFSIWARMMRDTISVREREVLEVSPCAGVRELRCAIAGHLQSFRGMAVNPDQIVIGAGTEYLYGLIIKLLGYDKTYCITTPGYKKTKQIYENNGAVCKCIKMDDRGICIDELRHANVDIAHISPTHHFPTGITMPISRRYELLSWANESDGRYIIEDDYDSEFRFNGRPVPSLQSIDVNDKVIYLNTFSKSLTSTIRISYMILPPQLANKYYDELSFYSCTVSTFEQYTLAAFINKGYFEKHINRSRLHYGRKRTKILDIIRNRLNDEQCKIIENDSGLHFILELNTAMTDTEVKELLLKKGIRIRAVTDYDMNETTRDAHQFILNYSNLNVDNLDKALSEVEACIL